MPQVSMTVRMDSDLKKSFNSLCSEFGMSTNVAINIFAKAVVQRRCIPFEIRSESKTDYTTSALNDFYELRSIAAKSDNADLSLEEINNEIKTNFKNKKKILAMEMKICYNNHVGRPFGRPTFFIDPVLNRFHESSRFCEDKRRQPS